MNTIRHRKHLLVLLLAALLTMPAMIACDDDEPEDTEDMVTDTTVGDTTADTTEDTTPPDDTTEDTTPPDDTVEDTTDTVDDTTDTVDDTTDTVDDMDMVVVDDATIAAEDQTLDDLSTVLTVASVFAEGDGWVVIHEDDAGAPGPIIGFTAVPDGASSDITVVLDRPADDGETLHAMLHVEDPADGEFTFGTDDTQDVPAVNDADEVVMDPFVVTVPDGTPAIRLMVGAADAMNYTWASAEPAEYVDTVFPDGVGEDVAVTLFSGWRYEIVNEVATAHPFEILTETGVTDLVLLSQQDTGTLEGDAAVNWVEDETTGAVQFTVAASLSAANAYRCAIHTEMMRGTLTVTTAP